MDFDELKKVVTNIYHNTIQNDKGEVADYIPQLAKIFTSTKKELPWMTKLSISISNFLVDYWWLVIGGMILGVILSNKYVNSKSGKRVWHKVQLKIPKYQIRKRKVNVKFKNNANGSSCEDC